MTRQTGFTRILHMSLSAVLCSVLLIASCGGGSSRSGAPHVAEPLDPTISVSDIGNADQQAPVSMEETEIGFTVQGGGVTFTLDKSSMSLRAQKGEQAVIEAISSTMMLNGNTLRISPPEQILRSANALEFRGWYSRSEQLWYVARYRFWPDKPFVHLAFSVTDRHDNHPTEAHWESGWSSRRFSDLALNITSASPLPAAQVVQENAFSGGDPNSDPRIEEVTHDGEVRWRQTERTDGAVQLLHDVDNTGRTYVRIYPRMNGEFDLRLRQEPLDSPYPAANAVRVNIHHADGDSRKTVDQGRSSNALGRYRLDEDAYIQIVATGESGDRIVFEELVLEAAGGTDHRIQASRADDVVLDAPQLGVFVRDFWKQFPIAAGTTSEGFAIRGIQTPVNFVGGVGYTLDVGINADPAAASTADMRTAMAAMPQPSLPEWWSALDGVYTTEPRYRDLIDAGMTIIQLSDETSGNYGWMNWGDYQIGHSFHVDGEPTEDWGALQYDLAHGLLMGWVQNHHPYLWNRAQAGVRNAMDVQIAKFEPYFQKRSGAGLRKGQCAVDFHWCQENIPEFNYHPRSLLLYSHLTGEQWPRDIAQMVIDNSAYFSLTRPEWTLDHERILGWALRNLVYGAEVFPGGTQYNETPERSFVSMPQGTAYAELLETLVGRTVDVIRARGRVPGDQPVWAGQIVEGLIIAYESGLLSPSLADRTYDAIGRAVADFTENSLRRSRGEYEMRYYVPDDEWVDAATYGWFWVNSLAWAALNIDDSYRETFSDVYDSLESLYRREPEYRTIRAWSGVMGFASYAAAMYEGL